MAPSSPVERRVLRNRRLQLTGSALLLSAGMLVLVYVVLASPLRSDDHPGGFTPGLRDLVVVFCALVAVLAVRALRVALIIDATGLVIRNQGETTKVSWASRPTFETRGWTQTSTIRQPATHTQSTVTHRFRGVECVTKGDRIMIAATARMTHRDRVEELLEELRATGGRARAAAQPHTPKG